ncbi:NADPH-dependent FMN reductase [Aerococcus kribbianus]|uniref:NAD(P)H-dependent oxidoreductase n=1 Tax=Aerococcus kribbianus TaxID=2999064 RepID=A0A9X3FNN5_9LACT|nr:MULTISPECIES: NADPH-dependent FMN reductase [unclassified Aerococcus]MCZ0716878.1 NAD(P)H-dependent oxidoreductase [Aerococcus sp. YH-aer221]MCZ0725166.1 NAD(P)H-dependent oxidoreductase [Aerococcus sp. YH-aer222]
MKKIIGIVGSGSKGSTNEKLIKVIKENYQEKFDIDILFPKDWPVFDKNFEKDLPNSVLAAAKAIETADGVIISAAEYDHSIAAVLSNALAWLSFTHYPLVNKPVLTMGTSYGRLGSSRAQTHLHQALQAPQIHAAVMPGEAFLLSYALQDFDDQGRLVDNEYKARLDDLMIRFDDFIQWNNNLDQEKNAAKQRAHKYDLDYTFNKEVDA